MGVNFSYASVAVLISFEQLTKDRGKGLKKEQAVLVYSLMRNLNISAYPVKAPL